MNPDDTPNPPAPTGGLFRVLHALVFAVLLAYWTYMLLRPDPVPESVFEGVPWFDTKMLKFVLAKTLHLCSYAFMAVLGGTLVPAGRWRGVVLGLLVLHGAATELGQWVGNTYYATNRHGCIRDVLIDSTGVAVGAWVLARGGRYLPTGGSAGGGGTTGTGSGSVGSAGEVRSTG